MPPYRGGVGIALYAERGEMVGKILRCAQNDKEETETPQAFPSEMILPPIGKDEAYQAFPSEGKGDRRTAVDEVSKTNKFYTN